MRDISIRLRSLALVRTLAVLAAVFATPASAADLTVSAAASLRDAFRSLAPAYEAAHPGDHLIFNFAASDVLLRQIEQGAHADVFASADEASMDRAAEASAIDPATRRDFAINHLVLIVAQGAQAPQRFDELENAVIFARIAIGNPATVPAGRYAREALQSAGLWTVLQPRLIPAANVRQALDYVARGEVQAGFVYATDAAIEQDRVRVALHVETTTPIRYPIAIVAHAPRPALARAFTDFVMSATGQQVLRRFGFETPAP